jgi:acyl-CoA synthetase (AMP-forming)/AMP-acid ligase II
MYRKIQSDRRYVAETKVSGTVGLTSRLQLGRRRPPGTADCLHGRIADTIIVAGQDMYPAEVENALGEHPAVAEVAEVAVIGVPHENWGEAVHACVVLKPRPTATPRQLMLSLAEVDTASWGERPGSICAVRPSIRRRTTRSVTERQEAAPSVWDAVLVLVMGPVGPDGGSPPRPTARRSSG